MVTGFVFPFSNNLFHLPIVGELYDDPEFSNDAFIQSLRYFSSGLWMILAGSDEWIAPDKLFFAGLFVSRLVCFLGFLACADHLGIREAKARLLFSFLIAISPFMQGESFAGGGGLFVGYFSHSEIANGLFLLAIWVCVRGEYGRAVALCGITFFVNAFVGVWLGFVMVVVLVHEALLGRIAFGRPSVPFLIWCLVGMAAALPVLKNILGNPEFGAPLDFDYVLFLEDYWPFHFLIWSIPGREILRLALVVMVAAASFYRLPDPGGRYLSVLAASILLYLVGVIVPFLTSAPFVLNLHLLRSGTVLHLLATLAISTLAVRWWFKTEDPQRMTALLIVAVLALYSIVPRGQTLLVVALVGLLALPRLPFLSFVEHVEQRHRRKLAACTMIIVLVSAGLQSYRSQMAAADIKSMSAEWSMVAEWAGKNSEVGANFLVDGEAGPNFEYISHRSVWVDWKRGAASMWSPGYHRRWKERRDAVAELGTLSDRLSYAHSHGIHYLIETQGSECPQTSAFRTAHLCIVRVE